MAGFTGTFEIVATACPGYAEKADSLRPSFEKTGLRVSPHVEAYPSSASHPAPAIIPALRHRSVASPWQSDQGWPLRPLPERIQNKGGPFRHPHLRQGNQLVAKARIGREKARISTGDARMVPLRIGHENRLPRRRQDPLSTPSACSPVTCSRATAASTEPLSKNTQPSSALAEARSAMVISIARRAKAAPSPRERRPVALRLFLNDPPTPPRRALVEEARPAAPTCRP